jgi:adenylate cyclase
VRAADGGQVWSQRYDSKLAGIFQLQESIARSVVAALELKLLQPALAGEGAETKNPEAYRLYLLGRQQQALGNQAGFRAAVAAFEGAVREDAGFAPALVWLGQALWFRDQLESGSTRMLDLRVMELANRAVQLAPGYAGAWAGRCFANSFLTWKWGEALRDCRRAVELSPGDVIAQTYYGQLLGKLGKNAEAIAILERAARADPLNTITLRWLGVFQAAGGQREAARATFARGLQAAPDNAYLNRELALTWIAEKDGERALAIFERSPADWIREMGRAMSYSLLKQEAKSLAALRALEALNADTHYQQAQVRAVRGEPDDAFRELERAWDANDPALHFIFYDPLFAPLRADPRYAALLRRAGLPAQ